MSLRASVPSFFMAIPPLPIIIDFWVSRSVYIVARILSIWSSAINSSRETSWPSTSKVSLVGISVVSIVSDESEEPSSEGNTESSFFFYAISV